MKVCIISDVHGNLPALEAVLEHAASLGINEPIWNLGDFVGYGAQPEEVVQAAPKVGPATDLMIALLIVSTLVY